MSKVQISLAQATSLADRIKEVLLPVCQRIEIAGSIRRKKQTIGDIEIVCVPIETTVHNLFGDAISVNRDAFNGQLQWLVDEGRFLPPTKNGERYKQFGIPAIEGLHLDLFIAAPDNFGLIFAIRTGSAEFSHQIVTQQSKGGLLPDNCYVMGGNLWRDGKIISTPEESTIFDLLSCGWVEPESRIV